MEPAFNTTEMTLNPFQDPMGTDSHDGLQKFIQKFNQPGVPSHTIITDPEYYVFLWFHNAQGNLIKCPYTKGDGYKSYLGSPDFDTVNKSFQDGYGIQSGTTDTELDERCLDLTPFVREASMPEIAPAGGTKITTLFGETTAGSFSPYASDGSRQITLQMVDTEYSILDAIFYPWMKDINSPWWYRPSDVYTKWATPYPMATLEIQRPRMRYSKNPTESQSRSDQESNYQYYSYRFLGIKPTSYTSFEVNAGGRGNLNRQLTLIADMCLVDIMSDAHISDSSSVNFGVRNSFIFGDSGGSDGADSPEDNDQDSNPSDEQQDEQDQENLDKSEYEMEETQQEQDTNDQDIQQQENGEMPGTDVPETSQEQTEEEEEEEEEEESLLDKAVKGIKAAAASFSEKASKWWNAVKTGGTGESKSPRMASVSERWGRDGDAEMPSRVYSTRSAIDSMSTVESDTTFASDGTCDLDPSDTMMQILELGEGLVKDVEELASVQLEGSETRSEFSKCFHLVVGSDSATFCSSMEVSASVPTSKMDDADSAVSEYADAVIRAASSAFGGTDSGEWTTNVSYDAAGFREDQKLNLAVSDHVKMVDAMRWQYDVSEGSVYGTITSGNIDSYEVARQTGENVSADSASASDIALKPFTMSWRENLVFQLDQMATDGIDTSDDDVELVSDVQDAIMSAGSDILELSGGRCGWIADSGAVSGLEDSACEDSTGVAVVVENGEAEAQFSSGENGVEVQDSSARTFIGSAGDLSSTASSSIEDGEFSDGIASTPTSSDIGCSSFSVILRSLRKAHSGSSTAFGVVYNNIPVESSGVARRASVVGVAGNWMKSAYPYIGIMCGDIGNHVGGNNARMVNVADGTMGVDLMTHILTQNIYENTRMNLVGDVVDGMNTSSSGILSMMETVGNIVDRVRQTSDQTYIGNFGDTIYRMTHHPGNKPSPIEAYAGLVCGTNAVGTTLLDEDEDESDEG